jgi:hypothetical protein
MTSPRSISVSDAFRAVGYTAAAVAVVSAFSAARQTASACETHPDLHIDVTTKFDAVSVRNDYTLADIAELARQQHRDAGRALLGFYATEFGYRIDLMPEGDPACPARLDAVVTLLLQHRLIEIGQEAAENSCASKAALEHYRRLAQVDEQTVNRFGARAAAMLAQAGPALQQTYAHAPEDLDAALRDQIRAAVDDAIVPLHDARRDAQQAVNDSSGLRQLASSCSI